MHRVFTRTLGLAAVLFLTACGSMPGVPLLGGGEPREEKMHEQPAAELQTGAAPVVAPLPGIAVETPELNAGTQALFDRAVSLMQAQQYAAAEVLFAEITDDQPELAGPWVNLGFIHAHNGDQAAAQQAFEAAIAANPYNCEARNQLGVRARRAGQFVDAETHYLACIEAQPGYANAHLNLAILYELYMGRLGEALAAYNEYQLALHEPDTKVGGWMMDLERRVAAVAKR